ncbi:hypothetical protein DUNSADRAFT_18740 [Dunaliella salina]|uniref:Fatty acyl-CoA reductase n=1 Tax=Dunaliella salina TaxID=3046 RepID=A0ABQ7GYQ4_DUNSA|nr:hypothetical protein DUNSADRAFT_18740 [Dunaliella salina]|eukprot:KAF5839738.1 hypothetical protein DUNSADRAFT_18740 [Dunaliella salina]
MEPGAPVKLAWDSRTPPLDSPADPRAGRGTLVLGKNLTERLLRDAHCKPAPVSIVRPTLVSALAGPPYPGFTGNLAGPSGYAIAFAMGFFSEDAPCWRAYNHLDNVPADCVSSCIIGAAAVLLAGVDVTHMSMPRSDTCLEGSTAHSAAAGTSHSDSPASVAKGGEQQATGSALEQAAAPAVVERGDGARAQPASAAAMVVDARGQPAEPASAPAVGSGAGAGTEAAEPSQPSEAASAQESAKARHAAQSRRQALDGTGEGWNDAVSSEDELGTHKAASSSNGTWDQHQPPLAVFQCGSTCMQPLGHAESYALAYNFYSRNRAKARIMIDYVKYKPDYKPVLWKSRLAKKWTHVKIGSLALLLSCFGKDKQAARLRGGYTMWDQTLNPKNDFRLSFSVKNALALEALMSPEERTLFPLVWRGEWQPFMATYMAAVMRLFLKQDVPRWQKGKEIHSFVYIPNQHVA